MSRKKTARQVRQTRIVIHIVIICLILALGVAAAYLVIDPFSKEETQDIPVLTLYENNTEKKTFSAQTEFSRLPLFAEKLCVAEESESDAAVTAEAGIIFNRTDREVLYSHNAYEPLYPASVTKCMTFLTALKHGDLSAEITVTEEMLANLDPASSVAGLSPGDTLNLEQLLYGLMLPSGNDAANVIAWLVAGGEKEFVSLMNEEAILIGATGSHFVNAHGLTDPEHYTTAYDIYLIYNELLNYDKFLEVIGVPSYTAQYTNNGNPVTKTWARGIWYFTGNAEAPYGVTPIGGKTGTTPEAGYCLSLASSGSQGETYISVVLKAASRNSLYENMTALLSKIQK
ncbi:MAG: D-alanyl-D-alanine carboxypeptidase [Lachnospiraceae bacterium]|nr:D-alanyl-D-alanine carboxypeptidase [Lachnospiraceae bacterium]